jgi:serine/threonine protein kinase
MPLTPRPAGTEDGDRTPADPNATLPPRTGGPERRPDRFEPGFEFGRYRIEMKIGEGGMGAVYRAHDTNLDRPVALKVPRLANERTAIARFICEAQAAAALRHPNICPIYDVGQIDGAHFLSMAFVRGDPLAARVGRDRPLDPDEAARIVRTVALAMQAAHDHGVIHRDLKPANIVMDDRGEPIVMDFGLARRPATGPHLTVQGEVLGTPAYMPPEQATGDVARMGPASDIYSLGVVLYELLVGRPPFAGDMLSLLSQIALDPPPRPSARRPGLPARFDAICLKALAKEPAERWKSMRALADALAPTGTSDGPSLTLRIQGTRFAYRPPPLVPVVTVGRQRRKPGEGPDQGNDFVLRVAGNDGLSSRISRRHFEIHRTPTGFAVVDRSKAGLSRNGTPVPKETPVALADGDRLSVAGVVTLLVDLGGGGPPSGLVRPGGAAVVPAPAAAGGGQLQLEASVGDMVTAGD